MLSTFAKGKGGACRAHCPSTYKPWARFGQTTALARRLQVCRRAIGGASKLHDFSSDLHLRERRTSASILPLSMLKTMKGL